MHEKHATQAPHALALQVRRVAFVMDRIAGRALAEEGGLSLSHFMMLYMAARHPGVTQRIIASHLQLTEAAVSRQAGLLMRKGYVERGHNPASLRERTVVLTPEGRRALGAARRRVHGIMDRFFSVLDKTERRTLEAAFGKVLAAMAAEGMAEKCPEMRPGNAL